MKTKKLWIWSFIFGILATAVFYFVINTKVKPQSSVPTTAQVKETSEKKDASDQQKNNIETTKDTKKENKDWKNELLPIADGKRAISLTIADNQGIAGFIRPGSYVDVIAILKKLDSSNSKQYDAGKLLLQNVKVLAIGHDADDEATAKKYKLVTFEVSPNDGLMLGFATKYDLYLMLRKDGDAKIETNTHILEDDLYKGVYKK